MSFTSEWHKEADAKSERIFDFIVKHKQENDGNSPTYGQIMEMCNISSTNIVHFHLRRLSDEGLIRLVPTKTGSRHHRIHVEGGRWVGPEK